MQYFVYSQFYTINRGTCTGTGFNITEYVLTLCKRRGWPMVIACPMPDWGLSGATTTTFPKVFYCFYQVHDARGCYTIIIGDKDNRFFFSGYRLAVWFFLAFFLGWFGFCHIRAKMFFFWHVQTEDGSDRILFGMVAGYSKGHSDRKSVEISCIC